MAHVGCLAGVGKTSLATALAEISLGSQKAMVRIAT